MICIGSLKVRTDLGPIFKSWNLLCGFELVTAKSMPPGGLKSYETKSLVNNTGP